MNPAVPRGVGPVPRVPPPPRSGPRLCDGPAQSSPRPIGSPHGGWARGKSLAPDQMPPRMPDKAADQVTDRISERVLPSVPPPQCTSEASVVAVASTLSVADVLQGRTASGRTYPAPSTAAPLTTVGPQDSILTALRTMAKMRTRFLRVATGDGVTVGFLSDLEALQALVSRARHQDEPARCFKTQK